MSSNLRVLLLSAGWVLVVASGCLGGGEEVFPFPIHEIRLENGLRVLAVPYDSPGVVAYLTVVRTGSRNELEAGCSGFAHFFEHMMFKGSRRISGPERDRRLMRIGAESNAFTSDDFTCYHVVAGAAALEQIMEVEADRFLHLSYSEADLKTEAQVILGEYQKSSSSPYTVLEEKMRDLAFSRHSYKHTVIGFLDDIRNMPNRYAYSRHFYERGYHPGTCIVLVVGDVDPVALAKLARKHYGPWKAGPAEKLPPPEPPQTGPRAGHIDWPKETLPMLSMGYRIPAYGDHDRDGPALQVLAQLVFSPMAPLYRRLILEERVVESLSADPGLHRDPFLFGILARVKQPEDLPRVREAIEGALREAGRRPFPREQLEAVKSACRYGFAMGLDTPLGTGFALAGWLALSEDTQGLNRFYRDVMRVTPLDVLRVARTWFGPDQQTMVTLTHAASGSSGVSGGRP